MIFLLAELIETEIVEHLCVLFVVHKGEIEFAIFIVYVEQSAVFVPQVVLKQSDHVTSLVIGSIVGLLHAKLKNVADLVTEYVFIRER